MKMHKQKKIKCTKNSKVEFDLGANYNQIALT